MPAPRHRREPAGASPLPRYEPAFPLRSSDFDAVAPRRRAAEPERMVAPSSAATASALATSDKLFLAHS